MLDKSLKKQYYAEPPIAAMTAGCKVFRHNPVRGIPDLHNWRWAMSASTAQTQILTGRVVGIFDGRTPFLPPAFLLQSFIRCCRFC
jgi:hypothetical protein